MFTIKKMIERGMAYLCSEMPLSPGDKQLWEVTWRLTCDRRSDVRVGFVWQVRGAGCEVKNLLEGEMTPLEP